MATKKATAAKTAASTTDLHPVGEAPQKSGKAREVSIRALRQEQVSVTVTGRSALITHKFSEKARKQMEDRQQGKEKTKKRAPKVPEEEFNGARYLDDEGRDCVPAAAFKKAMVAACRYVDGLPMTQARGAFHVDGELLPILDVRGRPLRPKMRTDIVRLESGVADVRYRPEYEGWTVELSITYVADFLSAEDVYNLLNVAGFSVGIGEDRPEKSGGQHGRFAVVL